MKQRQVYTDNCVKKVTKTQPLESFRCCRAAMAMSSGIAFSTAMAATFFDLTNHAPHEIRAPLRESLYELVPSISNLQNLTPDILFITFFVHLSAGPHSRAFLLYKHAPKPGTRGVCFCHPLVHFNVTIDPSV